MSSKRKRSDSNAAREWQRVQDEAKLRDLELRAESSRKNNEISTGLRRPADNTSQS